MNPFHQLWGVIWYESKILWRRRAFKVFSGCVASLGVMNLGLIKILPEATSMMFTGELSVQEMARINAYAISGLGGGGYFIIVVLLLPLLLADHAPRNDALQVSELTGAMPTSDSIFVLGKIVSAMVAGLTSFVMFFALSVILWKVTIGAIALIPIIELGLIICIVLIPSVAVGVALGASQQSVRRALGLTTAWFIIPELLRSFSFTNMIFPRRLNLIIVYQMNGMEKTAEGGDKLVSMLMTEGVLDHIIPMYVEAIVLVIAVLIWRRVQTSR